MSAVLSMGPAPICSLDQYQQGTASAALFTNSEGASINTGSSAASLIKLNDHENKQCAEAA